MHKLQKDASPQHKKRKREDDDYELSDAPCAKVSKIHSPTAQEQVYNIMEQQQEKKYSQNSTQVVPTVEQVHQRILALENEILKNATIIAQMLKNEGATLPMEQPKWHHLLKIESSVVVVQDRKTMKLLGVNSAASNFFTQHSKANVVNALQKPDNLFSEVPPLLLLLLLNMMHSKAVHKLSFKIYAPIMNIVMQEHMHFDDDEYYWFELSKLDPPVFDDAFVMNDLTSPATMQVQLPIDNPERASDAYLKASNTLYCKMIATFVQLNHGKFVFDTSHLLQHVFAAK